MADCELLARCPFFNDYMTDMPSTAEALKGAYCRGQNAKCARYIVYQMAGPEGVPIDLLPTEESRAVELMARVRWGGRSEG